ncbi:glycoside hydrolase family 2 protein [Parapedobacter tibetensis]|nr:glycoside hydrolase family 2 TIM barrel-domain containing protein [Parapedobacter tibetensis]
MFNTQISISGGIRTMRLLSMLLVMLSATTMQGQQTEKIYLSGQGSDDMVMWDFYCTDGMNAEKWTKIGVPSCWELQGFGRYDYGFAPDSVRGKGNGLYKHRFHVPQSWKGKTINIVFEGVMTDAEVLINGKSAGPIHQGAFYAFKYDINKLLRYGQDNILEVTVAKHSANESVNKAERHADYWIFGGIFRPVWLEVLPATHIRKVAIDANADGDFLVHANVDGKEADGMTLRLFDQKNNPVGNTFTLKKERPNQFVLSERLIGAKPWSPESPHLYTAVLTLQSGDEVVHEVRERIGFRTIEVRKRDGIYVNGVKMKFKGINRHAFRPETGRATSKRISIADVELIKEMNMNAVRMAHYPPDGHFLDVCDSLGLFVVDELAGWHGHYDTPTGTRLLKEMIDHDGNHPSVVIWANGNEGGHNTELDPLFAEFDIQKRPIIHPWQLHNSIETQHYRQYNYGVGNYENGREIVMPTEFLHGWFDGGHGAGLEDYWHRMWHNPLSAGGFLWDFADQAVVRKDLNDSLDTDKHRGADGILGPHHEKEGSFFAVKEIWGPIHVERREITEGFDGTFILENRYHFTNVNACKFTWKLQKMGLQGIQMEQSGKANAPDIPPHQKGTLKLSLPDNWADYDVLYMTADDPYGRELFTWSFPISRPEKLVADIVQQTGAGKIALNITDSVYDIQVADISLSINKTTGLLQAVANAKGIIPLTDGPTIHEGETNFADFTHQYDDAGNLVVGSTFDRKTNYNTLRWTIYTSGWVKMEVNYFPAELHTLMLGVNFSFPEDSIRSVTYMGKGPYRVWKNRLKGGRFGVWTKEHNDTETGERWVYPEFKGYHANFYGGIFQMEGQRFTVLTETEDLFLRLFTPNWKTDQWHNYEPHFPPGDISFMHAIPAIGSRTQTSETTGPMGLKNILYDYEKDPARVLNMVVYFNFSAR